MYIANVNFLWRNSGPMKSIPLLLAFTASALAAEPVELFNGKNLTGWKAPTGTWTAVQSVGLDPANNKAFLSTPGTGVLLNSNADKTLNIESAGEWGDCELHVEFCVPKGSNSGIYLQNRYEVQVLDSFGKAELGVHAPVPMEEILGAFFWVEHVRKAPRRGVVLPLLQSGMSGGDPADGV